ncbi:uncharacterized protein LOC135498189 [Lineus longissimus]|uniref:uncharacterized protein LOC135498189 n=1 Tax=Lineus longissimus TaxID=88925 RepID=UPI00315DF87B
MDFKMDFQTESSTCGESHWKAAKSSSSKRQRTLAETGLEVGCCRHAVLLKALNMFRGEIYPYPLYLHHHLHAASKISFLCQDVICKYWPWMEKVIAKCPEDLSRLNDTKPFLSVFHAKAHDWTCQVMWGGRWQEGSAAQAGEEMEQANSYLSRASLTTKTMDKGGREEQLTAHALYWNKKKILSLATSLCRRYKKSVAKESQLKEQLSEELSKGGLDERVDFNLWKTEVQEFAAGPQMIHPSWIPPSFKSKSYVVVLGI